MLLAAIHLVSSISIAQTQASSTSDSDEVQRGALRAAKLQQAAAVCDFNGDDIPDIAVADFQSNTILVMIAEADTAYRPAVRLRSAGGPRAVVCADFDRDGVPDVASANFFSGDILIFPGRRDGTFDQPSSVHLGRGLAAMSGADFDGDGVLDLAVADYLSGQVILLKGTGTGEFQVQSRLGPVRGVSLLVQTGDGSAGSARSLLAFDASGKLAWSMSAEPSAFFRPPVNIEVGAALSLIRAGEAAGDAFVATADVRVLRKLSGDGQWAAAGGFLPGPMRVEIRRTGQRSFARHQVVFSTLSGNAELNGRRPQETDDLAPAEAGLSFGRLPGSVLVSARAPGGAPAVFGAVSTLSSEEFFERARLALEQYSPDRAKIGRLTLLVGDAEQKLRSGDDVGAAENLVDGLNALAETGAAPRDASPIAGDPGDVLQRLVNQVLLFGSISPSAAGTIACGQTLSGQIAAAGQKDSYTFSANAGEAVQITGVTTSGTLCTQASSLTA